MQRRMVNPVCLIGIIILFISLACGGSATVPTPTTTPLKNTITALPTYTPYPTYTPRPTTTRLPTQSIPTITSIFQPEPTQVISGTTPVNCVASSTSGYNTCIDNSGTIQVDVPNTWTDINGSTWTYNGKDIGVAISAAPNLSDFQSFFNAEGVFFGASATFAQIYGHIELLDFYTTPYRENCTYIGRYNYDDGIYRGKYDMYKSCGGLGGYDAYILGAREKQEPSTKLILVEIQAYPDDVAVRDQIWSTFFIYY